MIKKSFIFKVLLLFVLHGYTDYSHSDELRGKWLFEDKNCTRCHTIGRGRFVGPDLYEIGRRYDKDDIISWITDPGIIYQKTGKMPVNKGYPPMPKINVSALEAEEVTKFLLNNQIKKTNKTGGTIIGKVNNRTRGDTIVEGADVYLRSFMGDKKMDEKLSISNKEGEFSFRNLRWDRSYSLRINSNGVEYETARMVFPLDREVINLDLPIYDLSNNDSNIVINVNHHVIEVEDKAISVVDIYQFENTGNTIFIGKDESDGDFNKTIKLNVPAKAENINFIQGIGKGNAVREDDVVYDTAGFPPGIKRVVIAYKLPLDFGKSEIRKSFYYDTRSAVVIATESSNVKVDGLGDMKAVLLDNQNYRRWVGNDIKRGNDIKISYYSIRLELNKIEFYPIILFILLFLFAFLFRIKKNRGRHV